MPGLAIAEALQTRHPDWRVVMVGARRGIEGTILPQRRFPYYLLPFEPIYRRAWWRNLRWSWLAMTLVIAARRLLELERPAVVLGTGGYASGPVVWLARRRGIRTAILEQDAYPGLASRWLAGQVDEVYLGVPEAKRHLRPGSRTAVVVTGSPIAPPEPGRRTAALARFGLDGSQPVVLVMGGSQGSLALNLLVAEWLAGGGGKGVSVLWSAGAATLDRFRSFDRPPAVQVQGFIDPIADAYAVADLVVCRAGMMTLAEICAWGLPAILIPLPTAAADHQRRNAVAMAAVEAAVVLEQEGLTVGRFGETIAGLLAAPDRRAAMAARARARGRPEALSLIVGRVEGLLGGAAAFSNP